MYQPLEAVEAALADFRSIRLGIIHFPSGRESPKMNFYLRPEENFSLN